MKPKITDEQLAEMAIAEGPTLNRKAKRALKYKKALLKETMVRPRYSFLPSVQAPPKGAVSLTNDLRQ